ncbi:MAG: leucine-rich repeat domain-containing protein [Promethearchaeota archaeon]
MELIPSKIYGNFLNGSADKSHTLDSLINIIKTHENDIVRKECIETLNKLDFHQVTIFKLLENILISESNENLRFAAARVMRDKFSEKCLRPFLWALHHESSYTCLITIIKSLEEINNEKIALDLIEEINKILIDDSCSKIVPNLSIDFLRCKNQIELAEILINHITVLFLQKKFKNLRFIIEKGLVVELDFSKVEKQVINWKDRESLLNSSDIYGIAHLSNLKKISFFPMKWVLNNEYTYESSIALIDTLELINTTVAKNSLLPLLYEIEDMAFELSIRDILKNAQNLENITLSNITEILKNFLTLIYFKKKFPSIIYNVKNGRVISLRIEREPVITLPKFIKFFRSLRSLVMKSCKLYTLHESIGTFHKLEILDLEKNELNTLPETISYLGSLKMLNVRSNQLQKIPYSLGRLSALQYLNLEDNNLESLPKSIRYLYSLKYLYSGSNKLKFVPSSIGTLKSLQVLKLNANKIKDLPNSIGLLNSLEELNLDNNELEQLPDQLVALTSLKVLSVEENNLSSLPESLTFLESLEILKVGWNRIKFLPESVGNLSNLKHIRLTSNNLQQVPDFNLLPFSVEF